MRKPYSINRRDFLKHLFWSTIGGTAVLTLPGRFGLAKTSRSDKNEKDKKPVQPNIILVVVDDQIISSLELMPTIRSQLVDKGIIFTNSFCTSPVCAPSRASILTGQYLHNHGETTNSTREFVSKRDKHNTIAAVLRGGGYKTVFIGKYTHGYDNAGYVPPGWNEWQAFLGGAPGYYNYKMSDNGKSVSYGNNATDYSTDVLASKAYHFIESHKNSSQPFFMYLAPFAPHAPWIPAPRHMNKFDQLVFPFPLYEKDISDKPRWVYDDRRLNSKNQEWVMQEKAAQAKIKSFEALLAVDEMIEGILKMLGETGKIQETYIFYLADNGDDFSRHIQATGKLLPYEEGIRTPIILRGPGIEAGGRRDHLVSTTDLLPTIAGLAQVPIPGFVDGRSLIPLFSSPSLPLSRWRKACLAELGKVEQWYRQSPPPAYKLFRTRDFKYIEYETGEKEFYDLRLDPNELINTYEKLHQEQKRKLHLHLQKMQKSSRDKCREVEDYDISIYF